MKSNTRSSYLIAIVLLLSAMLVSGCSGSSDSPLPTNSDELTSDDAGLDTGDVGSLDEDADGNDVTETDSSSIEITDEAVNDTSGASEADSANTNPVVPSNSSSAPSGSDAIESDTTESIVVVSTRVQFDITVPAYQSNALQVRLQWGDQDMLAGFVVDESWEVVADFPTNTENNLVVTFSDNNGAITLGSVEQTFRTGTNPTESLQIIAEQFDTDRWDSDGDGVSNLAELIAGTSPDGEALPQPVQASLELMPTKIFRINWNTTTDAQSYRVLENPDGISGFAPISDSLESPTVSFDHRVSLYNRVNARYIVQACNTSGCVDSNEMTVPRSLNSAVGFVKASNAGSDDEFGFRLSLSADGRTLAVGSPSEGSAATGINGEQADDSVRSAGAVYVFVDNNGLWQQQAYIKASNTDNLDSFGDSISLSADGSTLVVGAPFEDSAAIGINGDQTTNSAPDAGAVYVFARSNGTWQQQAYLKASNTNTLDLFGNDVSLSADGDTLVVGAIGEGSAATGINADQSDNSVGRAGAVYVFVRSDGLWQQQSYLKASNTGSEDFFGRSVSLSADGSTLAVGASSEDSTATGINGDQFASDNPSNNSGAVYVFVFSNGLWQQQAYVKASNSDNNDVFGRSVSLSADGSTLAVGATLEGSTATGINGDQTDNTAFGAGAVYVFVRSDEIWQQQAYLKTSNTDFGDFFGRAISLSADGSTLVASATSEESVATGINGDQTDNSAPRAGAVFVFVRNNELWRQQAYVKASNTGSFDVFGDDVSLSADGATLAVGATGEDTRIGDQTDISPTDLGAVYLY